MIDTSTFERLDSGFYVGKWEEPYVGWYYWPESDPSDWRGPFDTKEEALEEYTKYSGWKKKL